MNMKTGSLALCSAALLLLSCVITGCGGTEAPVTVLSASAQEIADAVRGDAFPTADFVSSTDEEAEITLMFSYGVEDDAMLASIEDYVLGVQTDATDPRYFSVVRCKEGTDAAMIASIAEAMEKSYAAYIIDETMRYASEQQDLAKGYTLKLYDNGIVMTACDTEGNKDILNQVDAVCRAAQ